VEVVIYWVIGHWVIKSLDSGLLVAWLPVWWGQMVHWFNCSLVHWSCLGVIWWAGYLLAGTDGSLVQLFIGPVWGLFGGRVTCWRRHEADARASGRKAKEKN